MKMHGTGRGVAIVAATALATALAACGGAGQGSGGGKADDADTARYEKVLQDWYDGTFKEPEAPAVKAPRGKDIWLVSAGLGVEYSVRVADAAKQAAKDLGWTVHVYDAKFDPNQMLTGVQQAVVSGADAIVVSTIDCAIVTNAAKQAATAGIPIVGLESTDCDPGLYAHVVNYSGKAPFEDWLVTYGQAQAAWVIAKTKGEAKVVLNTGTDTTSTKKTTEGIRAEFEKCPTCEVLDDAQFVTADFGPKLQEKVQQAMTKNPTANAFIPSYDAVMTQSGGAQALKATGRLEQLAVAGGEGGVAGIEQIRSGQGMEMCAGQSGEWEAYSAFDALVRIFLDRDPAEADTGNGIQVCDKDHNLPEKGKAYTPPVDFVKAYQKLWGLG
jgi:ribose transport system substrate-binding protein